MHYELIDAPTTDAQVPDIDYAEVKTAAAHDAIRRGDRRAMEDLVRQARLDGFEKFAWRLARLTVVDETHGMRWTADGESEIAYLLADYRRREPKEVTTA